jgi:hypothetical protein
VPLSIGVERLNGCVEWQTDAQNLPSGRKEVALLSTWRRVYIQDDWAMIDNTTGRSEAAQRKLLMGTAAFATIYALQEKENTGHGTCISHCHLFTRS